MKKLASLFLLFVFIMSGVAFAQQDKRVIGSDKNSGGPRPQDMDAMDQIKKDSQKLKEKVEKHKEERKKQAEKKEKEKKEEKKEQKKEKKETDKR